jgi:uncharacterized membrane protein YcaP (DUF421 family)
VFDVDWQKLFVPQESLLELFIRGTLMYFGLFLVLRVVVRRPVVLCATIIVWSYLLDVAACRFPAFSKLVEPPPLLLIRYGKVQRHNLKKENMSEEQLESQMRQQGIDDYSVVKSAYIEPDGQISVVRVSGESKPKPPNQKRVPGAH